MKLNPEGFIKGHLNILIEADDTLYDNYITFLRKFFISMSRLNFKVKCQGLFDILIQNIYIDTIVYLHLI